MKHIQSLGLSAKFNQRHSVNSRNLPDASQECKRYMKSRICEETPDHIIVHVGANDLHLGNSSE